MASEIMEMAQRGVDVLSVQRVYGEPIERDGVTFIPVARVRGGWGIGTGGDASASGGGSGGMVSASPAGAYEIRDGNVRWVPAIDLNRAILVGNVAVVIFLLVIRSIARSRAARG